MSDNLILYIIPSLCAQLQRAELDLDRPLTEEEVLSIRDKSTAIATPLDVALKMDEARGYKDIDPENCWLEWQDMRRRLQKDNPK